MNDLLGIRTSAINSVKVHPVVLFSILDHYIRRSEGLARVIGTLVGTIENGVAELKSSFAVLHTEKGDEVAVGRDFNRRMMGMHQRVFPSEKIVGWYSTSLDGLDITEHSCLIHDFYSNECPSPVLLVVDTSVRNNSLGIKAFVSAPLETADRAMAAQFIQIPVEVVADEGEAISMESMMERAGREMGRQTLVDVQLDRLQDSMTGLQKNLQIATEYVKRVVKGDIKADPRIGHQLAQSLAAVPSFDSATFDRIFNNSLHDLLMIVYLSNLVKAQMAVSNKLSVA